MAILHAAAIPATMFTCPEKLPYAEILPGSSLSAGGMQ